MAAFSPPSPPAPPDPVPRGLYSTNAGKGKPPGTTGGGALGGAAAYLGFNGFTASTINWQSFTQVAFAFAVTPKLLIQGLVYSLLMGLIGGLFPAIRAARLPVAAALREL